MTPPDSATASVRPPADCRTKQEVRAEIDRVDRALIGLLAERHAYVHRIADLKESADEAFDPARVEAVIAKVRERAEARRLDPDQAELIWRTLIDWNVAYERGIINARHPEG